MQSRAEVGREEAPMFLVLFVCMLLMGLLWTASFESARFEQSRAMMAGMKDGDFKKVTNREEFWGWLRTVVNDLFLGAAYDVGWSCDTCSCGHGDDRCSGACCQRRPTVSGKATTDFPLGMLLVRQFRAGVDSCGPGARGQMYAIAPGIRNGFPPECARGGLSSDDFVPKIALRTELQLAVTKSGNLADSIGAVMVATEVRGIVPGGPLDQALSPGDVRNGWIVWRVHRYNVTGLGVDSAFSFAPQQLDVWLRLELANPPPWKANCRHDPPDPRAVNSVNVQGVLDAYEEPSDAFTLYLSFDRPLNAVLNEIDFLQKSNWVDDATRMVSVEQLSYNSVYHGFMFAVMSLELSEGGLAFPRVETIPFVQHHFWDSRLVWIFVFDVIVLLCTLRRVATELRYVLVNKCRLSSFMRYYRGGWGLFRFAGLLLVCRYLWEKGVLWYLGFRIASGSFYDRSSDFRPNPEINPAVPGVPSAEEKLLWHESARFATSHSAFQTFYAGLCVVLTLQGIALLGNVEGFGVVSQALSSSRSTLVWWFVIFLLVLIPYAVSGYLVYGPELKEFRSIIDSIMTLSLATYKGAARNYHRMERNALFFTPLYVGSFLLLTTFIMYNMFIAIVAGAFMEIQTAASLRKTSERPLSLKSIHANLRGSVDKWLRKLKNRLSGKAREPELSQPKQRRDVNKAVVRLKYLLKNSEAPVALTKDDLERLTKANLPDDLITRVYRQAERQEIAETRFVTVPDAWKNTASRRVADQLKLLHKLVKEQHRYIDNVQNLREKIEDSGKIHKALCRTSGPATQSCDELHGKVDESTQQFNDLSCGGEQAVRVLRDELQKLNKQKALLAETRQAVATVLEEHLSKAVPWHKTDRRLYDAVQADYDRNAPVVIGRGGKVELLGVRGPETAEELREPDLKLFDMHLRSRLGDEQVNRTHAGRSRKASIDHAFKGLTCPDSEDTPSLRRY
eukprot:TRINITY_DN21521_c0_g1_i1.p1 TRINITY_DN21521_c0_g1~~TRINITY_DN21521_c0_g1_i1.p1  ORF type:complete len:961 (+),score=283.30 TRINITY_DN21521_c0_g1_i1:201-3083(+)